MLKTALFDCAISEKCCSVDGGMGICRLFSSRPGDLTAQESPPPGICHPRKKKCQCPGFSPGGVGGALGADGIDGCINITLIFMSSSSEEFRN